MSKKHTLKKSLSFDDYDEIVNPPPENVGFEQVLERAISRRGFLAGSSLLTMSTASFITSAGLFTPNNADAQASGNSDNYVGFNSLEFTQVEANSLDTVTVPDGYSWHIVSKWGQPLWKDGVAFDHATRGTAATQALAIGDNNDGMDIFHIDGKSILVTNNEYTTLEVLFGNNESQRPESDDDIKKGQQATGVSIYEVEQNNNQWSVVVDSPFNRRITPYTEMTITGPARGHGLMKTSADPKGEVVLGTYNNCGNGKTPWGTYLACEENFNGYYSTGGDKDKITPELKRYGIGAEERGYGWTQVDDRFRADLEPNEVNRAGYVVEIDPADPNSTPRKLTALGRFKHENAEVVIANNGKIVVYLGDDERGEFLYRYVSDEYYLVDGKPIDNPSSLLESGTLYAAKFNDDGSGSWLALTPETTGMDKANIAIFTRMAASSVGATTMDRPEWVAANPLKAEAYCSLTNNKNRGIKPNAGGDETPVKGPNPREENKYGQIVRWVPSNEDHTADDFAWDLFVLAGNPTKHEDSLYAGSENINAENMFNSPDGLSFDTKGNLWIQTDGKYSNKGSYKGMGNNQMLIGNTMTGEIRRFMVAPNEAEVTGLTWSDDKKTAFVGIQHPGEEGNSNFPDGGDLVARSCVIAITKDDGSEIG